MVVSYGVSSACGSGGTKRSPLTLMARIPNDEVRYHVPAS